MQNPRSKENVNCCLQHVDDKSVGHPRHLEQITHANDHVDGVHPTDCRHRHQRRSEQPTEEHWARNPHSSEERRCTESAAVRPARIERHRQHKLSRVRPDVLRLSEDRSQPERHDDRLCVKSRKHVDDRVHNDRRMKPRKNIGYRYVELGTYNDRLLQESVIVTVRNPKFAGVQDVRRQEPSRQDDRRFEKSKTVHRHSQESRPQALFGYQESGTNDTRCYQESGTNDTRCYQESGTNNTRCYQESGTNDTCFQESGATRTRYYQESEANDTRCYQESATNNTRCYQESETHDIQSYLQSKTTDTRYYQESGARNSHHYQGHQVRHFEETGIQDDDISDCLRNDGTGHENLIYLSPAHYEEVVRETPYSCTDSLHPYDQEKRYHRSSPCCRDREMTEISSLQTRNTMPKATSTRQQYSTTVLESPEPVLQPQEIRTENDLQCYEETMESSDSNICSPTPPAPAPPPRPAPLFLPLSHSTPMPPPQKLRPASPPSPKPCVDEFYSQAREKANKVFGEALKTFQTDDRDDRTQLCEYYLKKLRLMEGTSGRRETSPQPCPQPRQKTPSVPQDRQDRPRTRRKVLHHRDGSHRLTGLFGLEGIDPQVGPPTNPPRHVPSASSHHPYRPTMMGANFREDLMDTRDCLP